MVVRTVDAKKTAWRILHLLGGAGGGGGVALGLRGSADVSEGGDRPARAAADRASS